MTKLTPHKVHRADLERIVVEGGALAMEPTDTAMEDNYRFLLAELQHDPQRVWDGLNRLEHVFISLADGAAAQQVFESLNSTSAPLREHELVHNYILMGLDFELQEAIEDEYWVPIETDTAGFTDEFLRDYLIQRTGRDTDLGGEHGIYEVFRSEFPQLSDESIEQQANEWRAFAGVYGDLLRPIERVADPDLRRHFVYINTFGRQMYPIVMAACHLSRAAPATATDRTERDDLVEVLQRLQTLYLRKMVVGESRDHLAARLCLAWEQSGDRHLSDLLDEIALDTPSDERVRLALRNGGVPHAAYVLQRLESLDSWEDLHIEHIFPQAPGDAWQPGINPPGWKDFSAEEQARYRSLLHTLGNLAPLESPLNIAAGNKSFLDKHRHYRKSAIASITELLDHDVWDAAAIEHRTEILTTKFLEVWPRPPGDEPLDEGLVRLRYAEPRFPGLAGASTELSYVRFGSELWEVRSYKELYNRLFKYFWASRRDELLAYSNERGGPITQTTERYRQYDALDASGSHYLFMGYFPRYMLDEARRVAEHFNVADDIRLRYSDEVQP